jgi:pimeloyl-ACP methyl ester carboxylesterase
LPAGKRHCHDPAVPDLSARDGTKLAYEAIGQGRPVVCLPGGPMQDSVYLGDLGGLSGYLRLIRFDLRGTGRSAAPEDMTSCRCDRLVDDVEALREHLGLERVDLLAHCPGANLAEWYAIRHPDRVGRMALVTPSPIGAGVAVTSEVRREIVRSRAGEPWFGPASAAFEAIQAGRATDDDWDQIAPFTYGRWDAAAQTHYAGSENQRNAEAAAAYVEGYAPDAVRPALGTVDAPVLLLAGEVDISAPPSAVAELASLFPDATLTTQPGAGHYPWLDDPAAFTKTVAGFLA